MWSRKCYVTEIPETEDTVFLGEARQVKQTLMKINRVTKCCVK